MAVYAMIGGIAVLAALALSGPRPRARPRVHAPTLPADLDAYLAAAEGGIANLRPGCAKGIRWLDPGTKAPTPVSIVYLHGFSASRDEIAPVCDRLGLAWGANVFYTRLAGHGADGEALGNVRADDWFEDANEAWAVGSRIGRRVVLVGTSTGGPLAAWLAVTRPEAALLVLVSPHFAPANPRARWLLLPWGRLLARLAFGRMRTLETENAAAARIWTIRHRSESLAEAIAVADFGNRLALETLVPPALVVYTEHDRVVSVPAILAAFDRIGSAHKGLVNVAAAKRHVLAGAALSPDTTDEAVDAILDFARSSGIPSQ